MGFDGSGMKSEEGGLTTSPSGFWRDDSILFGLFGYRGFTGENADKSDRFGGDIRVNYKDLSLGGGYIRQRADVSETTPTETTPTDEAKRFSMLGLKTISLLEETLRKTPRKIYGLSRGIISFFPG